MTYCQCGELLALADEETIGADHGPAGRQPSRRLQRPCQARGRCSHAGCAVAVPACGPPELFVCSGAATQSAGTRISYEFEVLYTLPEVIEDDDAAPEQNCAFASSKVAAWNRSCCLRAART